MQIKILADNTALDNFNAVHDFSLVVEVGHWEKIYQTLKLWFLVMGIGIMGMD